ncbi:MAG: tRNA 2-thiouridine(34) synthase MnmA [Bacteroidetes bacterium]|nr:tRNA 2-thiouridine(34) synthase MnmA [Bacteroidota bacterium]
MSKHGKVLVAMSGGIDSTVAAVMLKEQGYEVIGITMKTWDYQTSGSTKKETGCCSLDSINDARAIAVEHGIHHMILDLRDEFGDFVINNFVDEYMAGRTPNPCVLCNTHIKWQALLKRADMLGCEFIATGHYAKSRFENNRYIVSRGLDLNKDQSYVLWGLSQASLARTLLPLGKYHKPEIREIALGWGYTDLVNKSESYEICFIPDNDYRAFLKHRIPGLEAQVDGGDFILTDGTVAGKHKGYPFYTVGQRKGLEIALGKPYFVTEIDPETNTVYLGEEEDLQRRGMLVKDINLSKYETIPDGLEVLAKVRYKDKGAMATLYNADGGIKTIFEHSVSAIAPGQSAVWYEGDDVIGGGHIHGSFDV